MFRAQWKNFKLYINLNFQFLMVVIIKYFLDRYISIRYIRSKNQIDWGFGVTFFICIIAPVCSLKQFLVGLVLHNALFSGMISIIMYCPIRVVVYSVSSYNRPVYITVIIQFCIMTVKFQWHVRSNTIIVLKFWVNTTMLNSNQNRK